MLQYHIVLSKNEFEFDPANDVIFYNEKSEEFVRLNDDSNISVMDTKSWTNHEIKIRKDDRFLLH